MNANTWVNTALLTVGLVLFMVPQHGTSEEYLKLPEPSTEGEMSVEKALETRRSVRNFTEESLGLGEVSQLGWAAQGITDQTRNFRTAPSAGATYPLEVYFVVGPEGIEELQEGVYRYDPEAHQLEEILIGDYQPDLRDAALGQTPVSDAPVTLVVTAIYERTTARYGTRGERYVHMEAGHVGQNVYLQAESLGLGTVVIGAFSDGRVQQILNLSEEEDPLYIIPVGYPGT